MSNKDCRIVVNVLNQYNGGDAQEWANEASRFLQNQYAPSGQRLIAPVPVEDNSVVFQNLDEDDGAWINIKVATRVFAEQNNFIFNESFRTVDLNPYA